jgi:PqqD family protein of HPr-rel-A system
LARFQIKFFDPEAVVFDTASGDTHYLAPLTLTLFQIIQDNPGIPKSEIEAVLAAQLSLGISPYLSEQTEAALASLRRLGLLESP